MMLDPRLTYWLRGTDGQNFGDYLAQFFLKNAFCYPKLEADQFQLVGSVLDPRVIREDLRHVVGSQPGTIAYWCCGARSDRSIPAELRAQVKIFGVRGPLTRDALALPASTVMGDPGFLLPLLHERQPGSNCTGKSICIAHVLDPRSEQELLGLSGAELIVNPVIAGNDTALRKLLDDIASASFVLTASLHGAIVAAAYGVPFCFWDNGHLDVPFKWNDLAASIGIPAAFAPNLEAGQALWARDIQPVYRPPKLSPILAVAPFTTQPDLMLRALASDGLIASDAARDVSRAWQDSIAAAAVSEEALIEHSILYRANRARIFDSLKRASSRLYFRWRDRLRRLVKGS